MAGIELTGLARVNGQVATFLDSAASATLRRAGVVPRPNQFIYSETVGNGNQWKEQTWLSVTGKRPGLVINNGVPSRPSPCDLARAEAGRRWPMVGYLPDFPTQPGRVLGYLVKIGEVAGPPGRAGRSRPPGRPTTSARRSASCWTAPTCSRAARRAV